LFGRVLMAAPAISAADYIAIGASDAQIVAGLASPGHS